jgi:hypothetical protein
LTSLKAFCMRIGLITNHASKCCRVIFARYQFPEHALVLPRFSVTEARFMKMQNPALTRTALHPHTPIVLPHARAGGVTWPRAPPPSAPARCVNAATPWPALRPSHDAPLSPPLPLQGKRGLVVGIANAQSIAWGCASACARPVRTGRHLAQ